MASWGRLQQIRILRTVLSRVSQGSFQVQQQGTAATGLLAVMPSLMQQRDVLLQPWNGFACLYAKGGKAKGSGGGGGGKKGGSSGGAALSGADSQAGDQQQPEFDPEETRKAMEAAVDHLQHELAGVRTGRANPGLLENIPVEAYGDKLPLKACGTVTVRSSQLLAVSVFDSGLVSAVAKAIQNSPLSISPTHEGTEVLVKLPRMTKETIEQMVKLVHMEVEGAHQSIRRARQKGMDAIKKAFKGASEDDRKFAEKEVQKLTDHFMAEIERLRKAKDTELREHRD